MTLLKTHAYKIKIKKRMTHLAGLPNNLVVCSCFHFSNGAWEWWYAGWWEKIEFLVPQPIHFQGCVDGWVVVQMVPSVSSNSCLSALKSHYTDSFKQPLLLVMISRSSNSLLLIFFLSLWQPTLLWKKTPFWSLQMAPFRFEKLFLLMLSKWHPSALKNFSYQCLQNGTFLLWKTILTDAFKIAPFYSEKLFLPVLSNKPSQALKTLLSRSLQTTPLMFSQLSLSIPSNNPSHALKTLSLSIPSNSPSHALKTLLFYPL